MKSLSLVIPLYNEAENISISLGPLITALNRSDTDYELILVDNGSSDSTNILIKAIAEKEKRVKVVAIKKNQGYGWGIMSGLRQAEGEFIGYMCGDGQVKSEDVIATIREAKSKQYDLVKVRRIYRHDGQKRKLITFIYNIMMQLFFRIGTWDVNGTPKIFRRELLDKFDIKSREWFIDAEIMIKSKMLKLKIHEVPISFFPRTKGKTNINIFAIFQFLKNIYYYKTHRDLGFWVKTIKPAANDQKF